MGQSINEFLAPVRHLATEWQEMTSESDQRTGRRTFVGENAHTGGMVTIVVRRDGRLTGQLSQDGREQNISIVDGKLHLHTTYVGPTVCQGVCEEGEHVHNAHSTRRKQRATQLWEDFSRYRGTSAQKDGRCIAWNHNLVPVYRLALLVDYDYFRQQFGGDKEQVRDFWSSTLAYLNKVYIRDAGIKFVLVDDERLIRDTREKQLFPTFPTNTLGGNNA